MYPETLRRTGASFGLLALAGVLWTAPACNRSADSAGAGTSADVAARGSAAAKNTVVLTVYSDYV